MSQLQEISPYIRVTVQKEVRGRYLEETTRTRDIHLSDGVATEYFKIVPASGEILHVTSIKLVIVGTAP